MRLGELSVVLKKISEDQLREALERQEQYGGKLGHNLLSLGFITDEDLGMLLSIRYGVPAMSLAHFDVDPAVIRLIPAETARKHQLLPVSLRETSLTLAMAKPTDVFAMEEIESMTGYSVEVVVASEDSIMQAIDKYY